MSCRRIENYDPNKPVCNNQDDFNQAVVGAIQYNEKQRMKGKWAVVGAVVWLVLLFWAVSLALRNYGPDRLLHVMFAILFSPAYVLAYYVSGGRKNKN